MPAPAGTSWCAVVPLVAADVGCANPVGEVVPRTSRSWDSLGCLTESLRLSCVVRAVPGRSVPDEDSGIVASRECESPLLKEANGLRCFFSPKPVGFTTLFLLFITVPSRLSPPNGVCRGSGAGKVSNVSRMAAWVGLVTQMTYLEGQGQETWQEWMSPIAG